MQLPTGGRRATRRRGGVGVQLLTLIAALAWIAPAGAADETYTAPDPGGTEGVHVPIPAPGKFFGLNEDYVDFAHHQSPGSFAAYAHAVGSNVVKMSLEWWRAERHEPDQWIQRRWDVWQDAYDAMRAKGITPVFIVSSAPLWARSTDAAAQACEPCRHPPLTQYDGEWGEFVAEVARRFPQSMIQVWNEPNLEFWWGDRAPNPERYARLLAVAYDAVQGVELETGVETPVIGPGAVNLLDDSDRRIDMAEFLRRAYAAPDPMAEHIDALALNVFPHSDQLGANSLFAESFEQIRAERATAGDASPIYITESGLIADFGSPYNELTRGGALVRLYRRVMTMPDVGMLILHRLIEPRDSNQNTREWGYAWLRYVPPADPENPQTQAPGLPQPKFVYCLFADLANRHYPRCLDMTITDGPSGRINDETPTFGFQPENYFPSGFQCRIDVAAYTPCASSYTAPALGDGPHTFQVRARDAEGYWGPPAERAFRLDTGAPAVTITSGPGQGSTSSDRTPRFAFSADEPRTRFQCREDRDRWAACESPHRTGRLADGKHRFSVRGIDEDGNVSFPDSREFSVRQPNAVITDVRIRGRKRLAEFGFAASGGTAPVGLLCRLDRRSTKLCTSPVTLRRLKPGDHLFRVLAVDADGVYDRSPASKRFTIPR